MPRNTTQTTVKDSHKSEHLAQRLSHILARLYQGDVIDKHQLVRHFGVNMRTIERDLHERLKDIAERNTEGHWQLASKVRDTILAKHLNEYASVSGTEHLFPDSSLAYLIRQLNTPADRRATHVQPVSHEDLDDNPIFATLQAAISQHHPCGFSYKNKPRSAHPYRLLHRNGIWYLSAEEGGKLKNFSVALIEGLGIDETSHFIPKRSHNDYINSKDDVWFTEQTTEVLLRVAPAIAHYFLRRDLLPRQQSRVDSDGSLLITTHINHINQLLPVVRYWLPNVRIVQPQEWQEELIQGLHDALAQWSELGISTKSSQEKLKKETP